VKLSEATIKGMRVDDAHGFRAGKSSVRYGRSSTPVSAAVAERELPEPHSFTQRQKRD